jgi:radical SAM protein with 4Fe4S-binding SPASM domain
MYKASSSDKLAHLRNLEGGLRHHDFPPQVIVETTAACNLRCAHCGHSTMERSKGHMAMSLYRRIVEEVAERAPGTEFWPTFYGEAFLLDYRLFYMLRYARTRGLTNIVLNTNGTRISEEAAEWILDCGPHLIMFSLDGFTTATFESIRRGAHRDEVYRNVERLLEMKARRGLKSPRIEVQYSLMDQNEHEVDEFRRHWLARGADVKVREKLTWAGRVDATNLDPGMPRIACPWALRTCAIHWNGDMVACAVDYEGRFTAGNIARDSIAGIWRSAHRHLERLHLFHDFGRLPAPCRDCLDWQTGGGAQHFLAGVADAH